MIIADQLKYKEKKAVNEQIRQLQLELRNAQMNQHFVFNVLASIEYYLVKNNAQSARDYLKKFAQLIRQSLNNSRRKFISLEDDLATLKQYIELELFRLGNNHQFTIEVSDEIDASEILTQPLLIQPFVENAIKHGLRIRNKNCHLLIKISKVENELLCIVQDDGAGRDKKPLRLNHACCGIAITQERLQYLHNCFQTKYAFQINDLKDKNGVSEGTSVHFTLPFVMKENVELGDRGI